MAQSSKRPDGHAGKNVKLGQVLLTNPLPDVTVPRG